MTDDITPASELERAYLEPEPFQLQDEVTSLTRDLSASAGLFQRSLDMIGKLQEQLAAKPADDLAKACIAQLIESGAENYTEHHFGFVRDGEDVERPAVVTVQFSDRPSPHELRIKAEAERDTAQAQLAEAVGLFWFIQGYLEEDRNVHVKARIRSFISRHRLDEHAQAEQQEAQPARVVMDEWRAEQEAQGAQAGDERSSSAVDNLARALFAAFAEAEPQHPIALNPTSYWATFADMARAALATQPAAGEPVEIEVPTFSYEGMGCGLEDRGITDRYEAMEYGYSEALEQQWEIIKSHGPLFAAPPAAAHGDEAVRAKFCEAYESGYQDGQKWPDSYSIQADKDKVADALIATMRAQAGEGGEV